MFQISRLAKCQHIDGLSLSLHSYFCLQIRAIQITGCRLKKLDRKGEFQSLKMLKQLFLNIFPGFAGAADRTRTYDPIITNDVLYQLSYSGTGPGI